MILLVDDDSHFLSHAAYLLSAAGLPVFTASGSQEAIDAVSGSRPISLALVDLDLPDLPGLELIPEMKALRPNLPVVAITGVYPRKVSDIAVHMGAEAVLQKPVGPEWLDAIRRYLPERGMAAGAGA